MNDGVNGRYAVFRMNKDDMSIDNRDVWRDGASCDLPAYREVKLSSSSWSPGGVAGGAAP